LIRTVVDQIYEDLKRRILGGTLGLGARLYEDEVAAGLTVSRSAVREAMRLLEQEGLLVREPHRGLYVASPSNGDALDTAQLRAVLEAYAVRWADPPSPDVLEELERKCQQFDLCEQNEDRLGAVNVDREFHSLIAARCHNSLLLKKFHELDGHIAIFFHWVSLNVPGRSAGIGRRHRALAAALASADPDLFEHAVLEHYLDAAKDLARHLPDSTQEARELAGDVHY